MRRTVAPTLFRFLSSLIAATALTACVAAHPPYEEYTLARAAMKAAQDVDSARFSAAYWNRASDDFREGELSFKNADYSEAQRLFKSAIQLAERAENATRLKRFQTGDGLP